MHELTYRIEIKNCTEDDLEIIKKIIDERSNARVDLTPYYPQEVKKRILEVEMQKSKERLQKLCDDAYGKGNRAILIYAQKIL